MRDIRTGISVEKITEILLRSGYQTLESSVHGKNQTRFTHLILEKESVRYFCKVNNDNQVYDSQVNQTLSNLLADAPKGVTFLAPIETIEEGDYIFHIYPYIDQLPVSSESERFTDFQVPEPEIDLYLQRVIDAITYVEKQELVSVYAMRHKVSVDEMVVALLQKVPMDTPHAVEFLQHLLSEGKSLTTYCLAIDDIQPQNMFWHTDTQALTIFDLENIVPKRRGYDYSKFFAQLWVVYGREAYAKRFIQLLFSQHAQSERGELYSYLRFHMTYEALLYYGLFREPEEQERNSRMMHWIRREFLALANGEIHG